MKKLTKTIIATIIIWFAASSLYAFYYVQNRLSLPGLEGYEAEWDWQLLFFGITRLPFLLVFLIAALWIEYKILRRQNK